MILGLALRVHLTCLLRSVLWSAILEDVQEGVCDQLAMSATGRPVECEASTCLGFVIPTLGRWVVDQVPHHYTVLCCDLILGVDSRAVSTSCFLLIHVSEWLFSYIMVSVHIKLTSAKKKKSPSLFHKNSHQSRSSTILTLILYGYIFN